VAPIVLLLPSLGPAGSATGLNCRVVADILDGAGARQATAVSVVDSSFGGWAGRASALAGNTVEHGGYAGQLYDAHALVASATPAPVPEGGTTQLRATTLCDDGTMKTPDPAVAWAIVDGPVAAIGPDGVAQAAIVYEDRQARVSGAGDGLTAEVPFMVLDQDPDNFNSYANDDVWDIWQVQQFGEDAPEGHGTVDADLDGQDNRFEFIAGTDPKSPSSRFRVEIARDAEIDIVFHPSFTTRTYRGQSAGDLRGGPWTEMTNEWVYLGDEGGRIDDPTASNTLTAYRIEIEYPWR
jgi:hypothetical protein